MLITKLKIVPASAKREVVVEILKSVENALRGRTDCGNCGVFEEKGDEGAILYFDQWSKLDALNLHIRSDLFLRLLVAMELSIRPPEISFYEISGEKGMDWIKDLRAEHEVGGPGETEI